MTFEEALATAVLGVDTLWGGDVMSASGTGRFIADSWFSDAPLPAAYTDPAAARIRESGGVGGKPPDSAAISEYLTRVDIPGAIAEVKGALSVTLYPTVEDSAGKYEKFRECWEAMG